MPENPNIPATEHILTPLYEHLAVRLLEQVPELKQVDLFLNQTIAQGEYTPPLVLLEFSNIAWVARGGVRDKRMHQGSGTLRVHVVQGYAGEAKYTRTTAGVLQRGQAGRAFQVLTNIERIKQVLTAQGTATYVALQLRNELLDTETAHGTVHVLDFSFSVAAYYPNANYLEHEATLCLVPLMGT